MTVFVDHPQGVDHELCERVTEVLRDYLNDYAIDVSSPGTQPPLRRRPHFERVVGRTVSVRTADRKRVRGQLVVAGERTLRVDPRSEEHTSELQSLRHLVCRLLLEKKKPR